MSSRLIVRARSPCDAAPRVCRRASSLGISGGRRPHDEHESPYSSRVCSASITASGPALQPDADTLMFGSGLERTSASPGPHWRIPGPQGQAAGNSRSTYPFPTTSGTGSITVIERHDFNYAQATATVDVSLPKVGNIPSTFTDNAEVDDGRQHTAQIVH
jgi:hypothetical protein